MNDIGFIYEKKFITKQQCDDIKDYCKKIEPKLVIPYYNIAWGYGNLKNDPIVNFLKIKINNLFNNEFIINHIIINNKHKLIGPSVEWHQEFSNVNTYAPGFTVNNDFDKLLQLYIAIDDQDIENGCLKVIPYSHKLGLLPSINIVNTNFSHKRCVEYKSLEKACNKYGIRNIEMKSGDAVIFNHLLIHSSGSNLSNKNRMSIVVGLRKKTKKINKEILNNEIQYRKKFIINTLKNKIEDITKGKQSVGVKTDD